MPQPKSHYWMVTSLITYEAPEGHEISRTMNMVIETPVKTVPSTALNQATRGMLSRLNTERGVPANLVRDYAVLSVSWLGLMARDEFYDLSDQTASQRH